MTLIRCHADLAYDRLVTNSRDGDDMDGLLPCDYGSGFGSRRSLAGQDYYFTEGVFRYQGLGKGPRLGSSRPSVPYRFYHELK
jgi:hypothetical protein